MNADEIAMYYPKKNVFGRVLIGFYIFCLIRTHLSSHNKATGFVQNFRHNSTISST